MNKEEALELYTKGKLSDEKFAMVLIGDVAESKLCGNCKFHNHVDKSCWKDVKGTHYWNESNVEGHWTCHEFKKG